MLYLFYQPSPGGTPIGNTVNLIQEADTLMQRMGELFLNYAPRLLIGLLLIYFGFKAINRFMRVADAGMQRNQFDKDLRPFVVGVLRLILKFVLVVGAAGIMGLETTSFVAILAAMGFAVGLAFQGSLSNFAGGVLILFFKPFRTGDLIEVGEYKGRVREIQILYTVLETLSKRRVIVPNSILSNQVVENVTGAGIIRVEVAFSISYTQDIDQARGVIMQVINGCPYAIMQEHFMHEVVVRELGNSSVDLLAWVWANGETYWETYHFMKEYVKKAFDKNGITIPFPQLDVHLDALPSVLGKQNTDE